MTTPDLPSRRRLLAVGLVVFAAAALAFDTRSTYGARTSSDEPQYLLTALSLGEDLDLDISDEIEEERFRDFHEVNLNQQTIDLNDAGQRLSPHDPLLPIILAAPMRFGGWEAARITLAAIIGLTAMVTLDFAARRARVPRTTATWVVTLGFMAPPLTSYGSQVFPAGPAALAVMIGVHAVTAERLTAKHLAIVLGAVIALPWLAVKYVPLAAVLTLALAWRRRADGRTLLAAGAVLAVAGISYLLLHRGIYGGWTVYAAGDHFVNGEFNVVGNSPNYLGRSRRLIGLLVDRGFGLVAWAPVLAASATGLVVLGRRARVGAVSLALVAAGWTTATWVALTMHGWWWPGRQVVPIVPLLVVGIAAWVGDRRPRLVGTVIASLLGVVTWAHLAWEASTGRRTIIVDFEETAAPWYRIWRPLLPDHRRLDTIDVVLTIVWGALLGWWAWRTWRDRGPADDSTSVDPTPDETAPDDAAPDVGAPADHGDQGRTITSSGAGAV